MEIEVKFRLDAAAFHQAQALLATLENCQRIRVDKQENFFLDSVNGELEAKRVNFRLRHVESALADRNTQESFITIKGLGDQGGHITDGISRIKELEEAIPNQVFAALTASPNLVKDPQYASIELIGVLLAQLSKPLADIIVSAQFSNTRTVYEWQGLELEVDETKYAFGTAYEIEIESTEPEQAKKLVEELLTAHGIAYGFSKRSKFGNLKAGSIL
ncbi:hypothetical protein HDV03_001336 [Kappamyces sp. JEL0829]|nr:hypothetical protein HDV03_001336 [Kappamyces sp. JEL0829]